MTKLSKRTTERLTSLINEIAMHESTYARKLAEEQPYEKWYNWVIYGYQSRLELFDEFGIDTINVNDGKGYTFTIEDARNKVEKFWDEKREEYRKKAEAEEMIQAVREMEAV